MSLLVDLFGYLSIVLHGLTILAQSMALGGVLFLVLLARPFAPDDWPEGAGARRAGPRASPAWSAAGAGAVRGADRRDAERRADGHAGPAAVRRARAPISRWPGWCKMAAVGRARRLPVRAAAGGRGAAARLLARRSWSAAIADHPRRRAADGRPVAAGGERRCTCSAPRSGSAASRLRDRAARRSRAAPRSAGSAPASRA